MPVLSANGTRVIYILRRIEELEDFEENRLERGGLVTHGANGSDVDKLQLNAFIGYSLWKYSCLQYYLQISSTECYSYTK